MRSYRKEVSNYVSIFFQKQDDCWTELAYKNYLKGYCDTLPVNVFNVIRDMALTFDGDRYEFTEALCSQEVVRQHLDFKPLGALVTLLFKFPETRNLSWINILDE